MIELDPLETWRKHVGQHLQYIGLGASMAARHARQLTGRPDFETWAESELDACEATLRQALQRVLKARTRYLNKGIVK